MKESKRNTGPQFTRCYAAAALKVLFAALKWKKMFSYYLIEWVREAGAWRAAHWAPLWQSRLCCVYPPLSHTLIRLSFSLIETLPQWHSIRAAEWKPGYFYIFFGPTRQGPGQWNESVLFNSAASGRSLVSFCGQKWHINLQVDVHELYIQLLRLCLCWTVSKVATHTGLNAEHRTHWLRLSLFKRR